MKVIFTIFDEDKTRATATEARGKERAIWNSKSVCWLQTMLIIEFTSVMCNNGTYEKKLKCVASAREAEKERHYAIVFMSNASMKTEQIQLAQTKRLLASH